MFSRLISAVQHFVVPGIHYGLALPASPAELLTVGAHWLSRAFWQAKTLPEDPSWKQWKYVDAIDAIPGFACTVVDCAALCLCVCAYVPGEETGQHDLYLCLYHI